MFFQLFIFSTVKPVFKLPSIQVTWASLLKGGCLLLNESSAESSCMSLLHYFHSAISYHLSEKPDIWSLNIGLTVVYPNSCSPV